MMEDNEVKLDRYRRLVDVIQIENKAENKKLQAKLKHLESEYKILQEGMRQAHEIVKECEGMEIKVERYEKALSTIGASAELSGEPISGRIAREALDTNE